MKSKCNCKGDHEPRTCAATHDLCRTFRGYFLGSSIGRICFEDVS